MPSAKRLFSRRDFAQLSTVATGAVLLAPAVLRSAAKPEQPSVSAATLPRGRAPKPVPLPHFPDRLQAFVWRNWTLVPADRMAKVVGATRSEIVALGRSMGLAKQPRITPDQERRSYLTVIKRNWHLLPYEQLLVLLDWTAEKMAYTLREDDFLYIKLGSLKPQCEPLKYSALVKTAAQQKRDIARVLQEEFPDGLPREKEPLFQFVHELSKPHASSKATSGKPVGPPRFCSSYFALYGDPLLETEVESYPDGYLARLAESGVNGVWLQAVLYKLAPFPWDASLSAHHEERLENLRLLVARARKHGIGVYLYLNEPRAQPVTFYATRRDVKGVTEGDHAALCTSTREVQNYLRSAVAHICRKVPDLEGLFTITSSENFTNCWSHGAGKGCPRCAARPPADVIAEVNRVVYEGIREAGSNARLLAWDWGWNDAWAGEIIRQLPKEVALLSVSEWNLPIERGGVKTEVGEYSISAVGPGPRATRHWGMARERGLKAMAKIQAGNTWELSAVPYIPAVENVARHAANLREAKVDGLMLGWTLGGYPSPNLEVVAEISNSPTRSPEDAMLRVAQRRFGAALAPAVVTAWQQVSAAFREFPYHIGVVYSAPLQLGPANLLWGEPTGYSQTMVGFPYDDLAGWRSVYPAEVFVGQLERVAIGFNVAMNELKSAARETRLRRTERTALERELDVIEAAAIHFQSVANQARFVDGRNRLLKDRAAEKNRTTVTTLEGILRDELALAKRLLVLQLRDSRLGFEASNHYYYVPADLVEKVLNCRDLIDHWLKQFR